MCRMCVNRLSVACFSMFEYICVGVRVCVSHLLSNPAFQLKAESSPLFGILLRREKESAKRITLFKHSAGTKAEDSILSLSASHEGQTLFIGV